MNDVGLPVLNFAPVKRRFTENRVSVSVVVVSILTIIVQAVACEALFMAHGNDREVFVLPIMGLHGLSVIVADLAFKFGEWPLLPNITDYLIGWHHDANIVTQGVQGFRQSIGNVSQPPGFYKAFNFRGNKQNFHVITQSNPTRAPFGMTTMPLGDTWKRSLSCSGFAPIMVPGAITTSLSIMAL